MDEVAVDGTKEAMVMKATVATTTVTSRTITIMVVMEAMAVTEAMAMTKTTAPDMEAVDMVVVVMVAVVVVHTVAAALDGEDVEEEITHDDMIMMMAGLEYLVEVTGHTENYQTYDSM